MNLISVSKEPMWNVKAGVFLFVLGLFGFTPLKIEGWYYFAVGLHILLVIGALLLLRGTQRIGWRLSLEGNVLYYQKFNLYSSWKKRRSGEFSLATQKINSAKLDGSVLKITYTPGRELKFNTNGLNSFSQKKMRDLMSELSKKHA